MTPFSNLALFDFTGELDGLKEFQPCTPSAIISAGWAPLADGSQWRVIQDNLFLNFRIESKVIPPGAIKRMARERINLDEYEAPTKAQRALLTMATEQVLAEILPTALANRQDISVWIDNKNQRMAINTIAPSKCDEIIAALPGLAITPIAYRTEPATMMKQWLNGEGNSWFTTEPECRLANQDGASLALSNLEFNANWNVQDLTPRKLGLTFNDRITFVLRDDGKLTKVKMLDYDMEENDLELMVAEYRQLIKAITSDSEL